MDYDMHRRYIWFPILAIVLTLIMFLQSEASASEKTWQRVQETKILRLGVEAVYPPFRFYNSDDRPSGFDIEVAQKVAMYMGLRVEWVPLQKDEFDQALKDGIIDGCVVATEKKKTEGHMSYSTPFLENCGIFVARKSDDSIHGLSYLKGKRIGKFVDRDDEHFIQNVIHAIEVPITSIEMGMALLHENKIDGFFHDKYSTLSYISAEKKQDVKVIQLNKDTMFHVFGVKQDEEQLLKEINAALKKIQTNGVYQRIYKKYFGEGLNQVIG